MSKRGLATLALCALGLPLVAGARPAHPKWPPKDYALHYGTWDAAAVERGHRFDLVVAHPGDDFDNLNADLVRKLQNGRDGQKGTADDVIVLAYVTVGEDDKPPAGPPASPAPAGPMKHSGAALQPTKGGYPTRFLDQQAYVFEKTGDRKYGDDGKPVIVKGQDAVPDENGVWGSYYVNAGDKEWQQMVLAKMQKLQNDYGVDGFFLDTLDTASPWGNYAYTQPQMAGMLQLIRKSFPDRFILGNRGMFLLEKHRQAYLSSLDGMLYESMFAIWDWGAKKGIISPWVRGDYDYYKDPVLPAARQPGAFHLFFVNYLDPQQPNFFPLMHSVEDLIGRQGISNYVSDPLLQQIQLPLAEIFPEQSDARVPELDNLSVSEKGQGRFELACEISGLDDRQLGKDLFLDVRTAGQQPAQLSDVALLPETFIDYSALAARDGDRWRGSLPGLGLEQGQEQHVYARVVGKARNVRTPWLRVSLTTARTGAPPQVEELASAPRERSVQLTWKPVAGSASYRIYQGPTPNALTSVGTAQGRQHTVRGLTNNLPVYFSVAPVNAAGQEGSLCRPVLARAEDCTPPGTPDGLKVEVDGTQADLRWNAVDEAHVYKVYLQAPGEKYRIPVRIAAPQTDLFLPKLAKGKYSVWVTASDAAGNESRRGTRTEMLVK